MSSLIPTMFWTLMVINPEAPPEKTVEPRTFLFPELSACEAFMDAAGQVAKDGRLIVGCFAEEPLPGLYVVAKWKGLPQIADVPIIVNGPAPLDVSALTCSDWMKAFEGDGETVSLKCIWVER